MYDILIRFVADGMLFFVAGMAFTVFAFMIPRDQWWYWGWRIFLAGVTAYLAAKVAGHFYQPETMRPFEKLGVEPGAAFLPNPGFPSDHALFAMFLTLAVWFSTRNRYIAGAMLGLTLLICIGRVVALVHTPLDVIGGLLIAFTGIIWYRHTRKKAVQYRKS